jgi:hypothetical protein
MSDDQNVSNEQAVADEQQQLDERQEATATHDAPQEAEGSVPADESAPTDTDPVSDAPDAPVQPEDASPEVPETVNKLYEGVRVVTLTGGMNVVLAKASVLSNHDEQRISGEFPTAAEALADAENTAQLQVAQAKESGAVVGDELKDDDEDSSDVSDEDDEPAVENEPAVDADNSAETHAE